jgi:hypothetical protein
VIAYHGLPMTPVLDMVRAMKGKAVMVSYANPEQMEVAAEMASQIALDNGTFPAWIKGIDPDFDGYLEWATLWLRHPAVVWCLIPDKIDGTEEENDTLIDAWPLPDALSVPVFHMHESLDRLRQLMKRFPRIAIGSSGEFAEIGTTKWWIRMAEIMEVICDAEGMPLVKIHGLRMLDPQVTSHVPLSSGDSTNVARNVGIDKAWTGAINHELPRTHKGFRCQYEQDSVMRALDKAFAAVTTPEPQGSPLPVPGMRFDTPGNPPAVEGPGPMQSQHPAPCWCPYCGEPHSPAVRESRDAAKSAEQLISPVVEVVDTTALNAASCEFESHPGHQQRLRSLEERQPNSTRHDAGSNPAGGAITPELGSPHEQVDCPDPANCSICNTLRTGERSHDL